MSLILSILTLLSIATLASATYDPQMAMGALYYSKIAYCPADQISAWNCGESCQYHPSMTDVTVLHSAYDTQSFVGFNTRANQIVVAFRGSSNIANWIADLDFKLIPYPGCDNCSVHEGFFKAYSSMAQDLRKAVLQLLRKYPTSKLLVTGHSLGAAEAVLAAVDLRQNLNVFPIVVYNFGEPRVGNAPMAAFISTRLEDYVQYRVVHRADPVPHLPIMKWGYLHAPHELWYNNNGNTSWTDCKDSPEEEDPHCSDGTLPIVVKDHTQYLGICTHCSCTDYYKEMEELSLEEEVPTMEIRGALVSN